MRLPSSTSLSDTNAGLLLVGATTEAKNQLEAFGRMAFGGAGMIISDPLSSKMYDLWDTCYTKYHHVFGGEYRRSVPRTVTDSTA